MRPAREHSAGGLALRAGKLLLVQVENLAGEIVWCLPKGHLERGESAEQAALREVAEETGWRCRSLGPILTVGYSFKRQGRPVSKRVDWFEMAAEKKVGLPDGAEVRAVRWAAAASARRLLRYPTDLRVLLKWSESARRRG